MNCQGCGQQLSAGAAAAGVCAACGRAITSVPATGPATHVRTAGSPLAPADKPSGATMVTAAPSGGAPPPVNDTMVSRAPAASPPPPRPAAPPSKPTGPTRKLDNYEVLELLGQGGMGTVYRGRDTSLQRPAAIKCLAPQMAQDRELVERFLREARLVAKLRHDNICGIFHLGIDPTSGAPWFAMELVEGRSLEDVLKEDGALAAPEAARIIQQTAVALAAALAKGIIHRDIKPANIMLTAEGQVKVTDFGLGRLLEGGQKLTQANMIMGTAHYMSPEAAQGMEVDHRTDVYALGVTFFQLVTGKLPFDGPSAMSILQKHVTQTAPDVRSLRQDVDPATSAVIERMLAKKPEERYQDYAQLQADLGALAAGQAPAAAVAPSPGAGAAEPVSSDVLQTARQGAVTAAKTLAPRVSLTRRWKLKVPVALLILLAAHFFFWGRPGMVFIPGGTYRVGPPDELVEVQLAPFYIDPYEVTNGQFHSALGMPPPPADLVDTPKALSSANEAEAYLEAAGLTLPDEAQWQVAARGRQATRFPWGDFDEEERLKGQVATYASDLEGPAPVGTHALDVSSFGCYDMAGNVQELVRVTREAPEPGETEASGRRRLRVEFRMSSGAEGPPPFTTLGASWNSSLNDESLAWKDLRYLYPVRFSNQGVGFRGVHEVGFFTRVGEWIKVGATWLAVLALVLFL